MRWVKNEKGATAAPFSWRERLALLPARLLFTALGFRRFLCHWLSPPSLVGFRCEELSPHCIAAASRHVGCLCRRPSLRCNSRQREVSIKKIGGVVFDTPWRWAKRLALLPARLFLSALCSLLSHEFLLELGSSAVLRPGVGYNRWAERSTLIQDVDYG